MLPCGGCRPESVKRAQHTGTARPIDKEYNFAFYLHDLSIMFASFRFIALLLVLNFFSSPAIAEPTDLPEVTDFRIEAAESAAKKIPILVLFKSDYCPYCAEALRNFLMPMIRDPEMQGKVIMREIIIDSKTKVIDFNGQTLSTLAFSAKVKIWGVPHVMLFDQYGNKLNEIKGLVIADFYYSYLKDAIADATAKILAAAKK